MIKICSKKKAQLIKSKGGSMFKRSKRFFILLSVLVILAGCSSQKDLKIDYEKYTLENGLEVILHEDKSDPIAAVAVQYHVGSNREIKGRTGFAHLFEHMMFQESQHVEQDQFFKKIQSAGGMLNGGTSNDGTIYFEVVPKNALEMALWLEADRLGFLLPRVTKDAFINQQNVVQNEKRQGVDNSPYGHTSYVISKLLYPEDHPYNWQVIGEMEDLTNATLKDVHEFHQKWYRPNNATLVVAGDFDKVKTKEWIEKYFGEIESGDQIEDLAPMPITLDQTKRAFHEDNFAKSPELNIVIPTVQQYTDDAYALDLMGQLFSYGKKAPLYKVIVEEKKLAPSASGYNSSQEIAGVFRIRIRTFPGKNLTDVEHAVFEAFEKFETEKFTEKDLARIKAGFETGFYNGISSILGKSFQLANYNEYAGSPGFLTEDLNKYLAVTSEDIWRVYNQYIKDKQYVITSFVPKGQAELVAENSERYPIVEESASQQVEITEAKGEDIKLDDISSSFDRSVEPSKGLDPLLSIPEVWKSELANGIKVFGIEHDELPLIQFSITLQGGMLLDDPGKIGVANLITDVMMEGTANKTPIELEEAIDELGAYINMYTSKESIVISANCLSTKVNEVFALIDEIIFEPRWDEKEFERIKSETIETIKRNLANPPSVASNVFTKLVYGKDHLLSNSTYGTEESVNSISMGDLKKFYKDNFSPSTAHIVIVGDISESNALNVFKTLEKWEAKEVKFPEIPTPTVSDKTKIYFVDFPKAKQSQVYAGCLGMKFTDPDYYKAYVMNYKLGGSFNGFLNLILREEKGFTYGARSGFSGSKYPGRFTASSSVRSTATFESVMIVKDLLTKYQQGISEEDMQFTKDALIKSNARRFETLGALLGMVNQIANYDLPDDFIKEQETIIRNMTIDEHKQLAQKYISPDKMIYLVVGDAASQMHQLRNLGLGAPILIDKDGNVIN